MASPFPVVLPPSETRKVRDAPGVLMRATDDAAKGPILPVKGEKNVLITSALPYVNNVPHLGNIIGSTLSADVYARYSRTRNRRTLYVCGTDEYGTATETKALEEKTDPKSLCDKYNALHKEVYEWFEIGFDYFGRTTTPKQTEIAQEIFLQLLNNGYLEERSMQQLWCEGCRRFLADRYVEGTCPKCGYDDARGDQCDSCGQLLDAVDLVKPRCKLDGTPPVKRDSLHMFLRMDLLQPPTEKWAEQAYAEGKWSANGKMITDSWFREGLKPFSITRDLKWGVPVPVKGMEEKVLYVWFDAPIGYPSITANYTDEWEKWWKDPDNVKLYQFMGKDNVRFHSVIFPACLIGCGDKWTKLHHISTTEYLQYEGGKFSKSRNIGVFGNSPSLTGVPPSVWRYYLMANRPEASDSQFAWKDFISRNNAELLNNVGNFVNRVIKFVVAKYDSVLPEAADVPAGEQPENDAFAKDVNELLSSYIDTMDAVKLRQGLSIAMSLSARGNQYLQESRLDNTLFASNRAVCDAVVLKAINLIYALSAVFHPFMPSTSDGILRQLDAPARAVPERFSVDLLPGHKIGKPEYLFKRVDEKMEQTWREKFGGAPKKPSGDGEEKPPVSKKKAQKAAKEAAKKAAGDNEKAMEALRAQFPELVALEAKIKAQGEKVRDLKTTQKADGGVDHAETGANLQSEVLTLQSLKKEVAELADQLSKKANLGP